MRAAFAGRATDASGANFVDPSSARAKAHKLIGRYTEDTFYARCVAHADLGMRFCSESSTGIGWLSFYKQAADGIKRDISGSLANRVHIIDDGAVEASK